MSGLDLRSHVEFCRAHHFRRRTARGFALGRPGRIVDAGMGAVRHQFMIGRMEFDLVAPVPRASNSRSFGGFSLARRPRAAIAADPNACRTPTFRRGCGSAVRSHRLRQRTVQREQIDVLERRRLIEDLVRPE